MKFRWLKFFAAFLSLTMIFMTGCDGASNGSEEGTEVATVETSEPEPIVKVGYIFNNEVDNGGFTGEINAQRLTALSHSELESMYIDDVSISDFEKAVEKLSDAGCTYIVSCSPVYANALTSTSQKYMNINFIGYGMTVSTVNIYAYTEHIYQGAYIAGLAAAYNTVSEKVGIVVDPAMLYSTPVINAAALGIQFAFKNTELYTAFASKDSEIHTAIDALTDEGCDIVICYTNSSESAEYCEKNGIKFIGCLDYNESKDEYDNMLMYFCGKRDSFFLSQFKQIELDQWAAMDYVGDMSNGFVSVSEALSAAKDGTEDIIKAIVPKVSNGSAYIFSGELRDNSGTVRYLQTDMMDLTKIYNMDWYVDGVTILGNYRQPLTELPPNSLEIQY